MGGTRTVTQGDWSVSLMSGSDIKGFILQVNRHHTLPSGRYVIAPGDHNGKRFTSSEAAWEFALDKGYTREYFRRVWCRKCREQHGWCSKHREFV